MANARKNAIAALCEVERNGAYSNLLINKYLTNDMSPNDRALCSALFYGVLDRKITIDYCISLFVSKPIKSIAPITLAALRIAIFQLLFMEKIPESAAVNESVNVIKFSKERFNVGFANAVLRNFLRVGFEYPKGDSVTALSVRYSCPVSIINSFISDYGKPTAISLLQKFLEVPSVILRVNNIKTDKETLYEILTESGTEIEFTKYPNALKVIGGIDIANDKAYKQGLYHIENFASQFAIQKLDLHEGESVLDLCAAPGGKSFTMAQMMNNQGKIISFDLYEKRAQLIEKGAKRLGIDIIDARQGDATVYNEALGTFDAVLCDVPCSGFGVIARKPEIKYKKTEDFSQLEEIQSKILGNAAKYVKSGGRLMYSTCTLRKAENENAVKSFLDKHSEYRLQYEHTFMPHIDGTDGFYCALMTKSR